MFEYPVAQSNWHKKLTITSSKQLSKNWNFSLIMASCWPFSLSSPGSHQTSRKVVSLAHPFPQHPPTPTLGSSVFCLWPCPWESDSWFIAKCSGHTQSHLIWPHNLSQIKPLFFLSLHTTNGTTTSPITQKIQSLPPCPTSPPQGQWCINSANWASKSPSYPFLLTNTARCPILLLIFFLTCLPYLSTHPTKWSS